jgi:Zn-dependent protease
MDGSDALGGSFKVGRLAGVDVKVHILFVVFIGLTLLQAGGAAGVHALHLALLFGSVLLHELGHVTGARWMGGDAREVILWPLGGLAPLRLPEGWKPELVATATGPAVNLLLAIVSALVLVFAGGAEDVRSALDPFGPRSRETALTLLAGALFSINVLLLLFNILPAYPMDGGQLLRAGLWPLLGWRRATLVATSLGVVVGVAFIGLAVAGQGINLGLIGALVVLASWQELQRARQAGGWQR